MKPETSKTAVAQLIPMFRQENQDDDDEVLNLEEYKACIQSEVSVCLFCKPDGLGLGLGLEIGLEIGLGLGLEIRLGLGLGSERG